MNFVVVGSGVSAFSTVAALIEKGIKPTVLDIGANPVADLSYSVKNLSDKPPGQWTKKELEFINPLRFDSILILSPGGSTIEEMDAYVISLLIRIRQILLASIDGKNKNRKWPKLITEVMDSENIDIILNSGVEDFMVSNQFVSQIMAQVSEEPLALDVYDDLFRAEGSEIYIKPASNYFDFSESNTIKIKYGECIEAAQLREEIILGLQFYKAQKDKENMFGLKLIPDKNEIFTLNAQDGFIALAQDEG